MNIFTDANFKTDVLQSDKLTVVDFWAIWCPSCLVVGKTLEEISGSYDGKVNIGKVNVDENPEISVNYSITNIPVVLFIKNGQIVDKHVGAAGKNVYEKKIQQHIPYT